MIAKRPPHARAFGHRAKPGRAPRKDFHDFSGGDGWFDAWNVSGPIVDASSLGLKERQVYHSKHGHVRLIVANRPTVRWEPVYGCVTYTWYATFGSR